MCSNFLTLSLSLSYFVFSVFYYSEMCPKVTLFHFIVATKLLQIVFFQKTCKTNERNGRIKAKWSFGIVCVCYFAFFFQGENVSYFNSVYVLSQNVFYRPFFPHFTFLCYVVLFFLVIFYKVYSRVHNIYNVLSLKFVMYSKE